MNPVKTILDEFALAAIPGVMHATESHGSMPAEPKAQYAKLAKISYDIAHAMMAERNKRMKEKLGIQ